MGTIEIYALTDAEGSVRYVGKAINARKRMDTHVRDARRRYTRVCRWVKSLGKVPTFIVLEVCDAQVWPDRERFWIAHYRDRGAELLNMAEGGDEPGATLESRRRGARAMNLKTWNDPLARGLNYLARGLSRGLVSEKTKALLRSRPDVFGSLAKYL